MTCHPEMNQERVRQPWEHDPERQPWRRLYRRERLAEIANSAASWLYWLLVGLLVIGWLCIFFWPTAANAQASPATDGVLTVEVFANSAMVIKPTPSPQLPYKLNVYRIDGLHGIEQELNQQLPQSEEQARQWMFQHQDEIAERYGDRVASAARGLTLMMRYRLNRVPAIVINQRVVVYGMTDIKAAIARAREQLGDQPL